MFPLRQGLQAGAAFLQEVAGGLTGGAQLEPADLVEYFEDPDDRSWWVWDRDVE
ncbi:MAG: hypothetical protein P8099_19965 [Gemmatimonadota bacterium]